MDDEGANQAIASDAGAEAPAASEREEVEISVRRMSLQAAGGMAEEQEGEAIKVPGSVDSEHAATETDQEEGKKPFNVASRPASFSLC